MCQTGLEEKLTLAFAVGCSTRQKQNEVLPLVAVLFRPLKSHQEKKIERVCFLVSSSPVLAWCGTVHVWRVSPTANGLLRLLRPLQWQHLYIPLLPMSCRHVLKHAVDAKEPFLIGTCTTVLER